MLLIAFLTAMLRNKTNVDYWLGMWAPSGNTFNFEDNSLLDYTNWAPNKPGNIYGVILN